MTSIERFNMFAKSKYEKDPERSKTVISAWPPWRIPKDPTPFYKDPRRFLHSRFCHGLIFNLLHKSLNASLTNDTITSLAVHLLELAVTYPQKVDKSIPSIFINSPRRDKYNAIWCFYDPGDIPSGVFCFSQGKQKTPSAIHNSNQSKI